MMFKLLALALASYIAYGLTTGAIYAKAGVWGRSYSCHADPRQYWSTITVYSLLTIALIFVF